MALKLFILTTLVLNVLCDDKDGGKAPRIPLNDGNTIPAAGLGTFLGFDENGFKIPAPKESEGPVAQALDAGYRLIDTASGYQNEDQVGAAVRASSVPRENIFIVTKLGSTEHRDVVKALMDSLTRLNMTYVDLYLIHSPITYKKGDKEFDDYDYLDTWKGMEKAKKLGLAKSIGLSNFNISQIERVLANCEIKPAVLQVEVNLNLAQNKLVDFCKAQDIVVMAYTPFGSLFDPSSIPPPPRADDPTLLQIAGKYKKTAPQIALRYLVQRGLVPIPKSVKKERIEENINIFDFELSSEDMDTLGKFNKDYRTVVWPSALQGSLYYPFERRDVTDANSFDSKNS